MIYNSFYGLTFNPFDKQQLKEKDCFQSRDFKEMNVRLNHLKTIRGIGVFTALPGMGKSYALRCFAKGLNPNQYHMEYMCLSTISVADFYKQFCAILGVPDKGGKPAMFKAIQEQIMYLYRDKHQPLLLAIDEAQYLSNGILNDIKMLMNYGYDSLNCFTLILCGESHLNDILRKRSTKHSANGSPYIITMRAWMTVKYQNMSSTSLTVPGLPAASSTMPLLEPSMVIPVEIHV